MGPFARAVSIAIGNEAGLEAQFDHVAQGMMPTRSRNGAALILRRFGSWMKSVGKHPVDVPTKQFVAQVH